jgi:putative ATPase
LGIGKALSIVEETGNEPVPLHLRNAPTKLMTDLGYGADYKYAHNFPGHFVDQQYLPDALKEVSIWKPQENPAEEKLKERMNVLWKRRSY